MKKIIGLIFPLILNFQVFCQTQFEMNETAKQKYLNSHNKLDSIYTGIKMIYSSDTLFVSKFNESISVWEKYRDIMIETRFPGGNKNDLYGSIYPLCYYTFLRELIEKRIDDVVVWLIGVEEGEACAGSIKFKEKE
jgi:hypothetical protein